MNSGTFMNFRNFQKAMQPLGFYRVLTAKRYALLRFCKGSKLNTSIFLWLLKGWAILGRAEVLFA